VALCEGLLADTGETGSLKWAKKPPRIIARFGRFPHRNGYMGRDTTPEEQTFLDEGGGGGFGLNWDDHLWMTDSRTFGIFTESATVRSGGVAMNAVAKITPQRRRRMAPTPSASTWACWRTS